MEESQAKASLLTGAIALFSSAGFAQPCLPSQSGMLVPDDGEIGDGFGWAVAIDGDTAIVGSHNGDAVGFDSGYVYIYRFDGSGWDEVQKLVPAGLGSSDGFGDDVAISSSYLVVGTPGDDDFGLNLGAAYVFENVARTPGKHPSIVQSTALGDSKRYYNQMTSPSSIGL